MKSNEFNNILNECLERILQGDTVEQCLRSHPEQAHELEPLLRTALAAKVISDIKPRPEFKARARLEFQSALQKMESRRNERAGFFHWHWQWRWQSGWAIAIVAIIIVVLAGGSTVAAAGNSMPDSTLYPVKLTTERVQMVFTFSDMGKAELNAKQADTRVEEMVYLASKGDTQEVQVAAQRLNSNLKNLSGLAEEKGRTEAGLTQQSQNPAPRSTATNESRPMIAAASGQAPAGTATSAPAVAAAPIPSPAPALTPAPLLKDNNLTAQTASSNVDSSTAKSAVQSTGKPSEKDEEREKLRQIITQNAASSKAKLNEALSKASPDVRPALRQALAQSESEYDKAIKNLDHSQDKD